MAKSKDTDDDNKLSQSDKSSDASQNKSKDKSIPASNNLSTTKVDIVSTLSNEIGVVDSASSDDAQLAQVSAPKNYKIMKGVIPANLKSQQDIHKSGVSLSRLLMEYRTSYTDTCFRRTAPYKGTMPVTFEYLLHAAALATDASKGKRVKINDIASIFGKVGKFSDTTYSDLCRMTAEPFPLISGGRAVSDTATKSKEQPLIEPQNGFLTAQRYARIQLSELGKLATRWYGDIPITEFNQHKSIVPLALIRKTIVWTLGFRTEMRPLNPSELFSLMVKMIDKQSMELSDVEVEEVFRGVDLGEDYVILMTNESLMSLYSSGRGSITVVPNIEINRAERSITFKRPVLDSYTDSLLQYLGKRRLDIDTGNAQPYITFGYSYDIIATGNKVTLRNVDFYGADSDILYELWQDPKIQKTVKLTNVILDNYSNLVKDNKASTEFENGSTFNETLRVDDSLSSVLGEGYDYKADIKSIKEVLWQHIQWEVDKQLESYRKQLALLEEELKFDLLLEKVTRPEVAEYVHSIMKQPNRIGMLVKELGEDSNTELKKKAFADGSYFTLEEAGEIYRETGMTKAGNMRINILSVLFKREAYENLWKDCLARLNEVRNVINNPVLIYNKIRDTLMQYIAMPNLQRKSPVYFLQEMTQTKIQELTFNLLPKPEYNLHNMPVTIYNNSDTIFKSFGVNMNIFINQKGKIPGMALNCLTSDIIAIYANQKVYYTKVSDISFEPYNLDNIQGILPIDFTRRLIVNVVEYASFQGVTKLVGSEYIIMPPGYITSYSGFENFGIAQGKVISGWAYLDTDDKYIEFYTTNNAVARIDKSEIPADSFINQYPENMGIVTDISTAKNIDEPYAAMRNLISDFVEGDGLSPVHWGDYPVYTCGDTLPYSTKNLELYWDNIYVELWTEPNFVLQSALPHGKKSVITETRWIRTEDSLSKKIRKHLSQARSEVKNPRLKFMLVNKYESQAYKDWNVSQLEDWSIIDRRFELPSRKPYNPEAVKVCEDYMERRFNVIAKREQTPLTYMRKHEINFTASKEDYEAYMAEINKTYDTVTDAKELLDVIISNENSQSDLNELPDDVVIHSEEEGYESIESIREIDNAENGDIGQDIEPNIEL